MVNRHQSRICRIEEIVWRDIPGVTRVQAAQHLEACLVCLDYSGHSNNVEMVIIEEDSSETCQLVWSKVVDDHVRRSWKDLQEATEYGAVAIAIWFVVTRTDYTVIERAVKGSGFDYWLIENELYDEDVLFPKGSARLEVSGMIHAQSDSDIRARVAQKMAQTGVSDHTRLPAIVIVVEFSRPEVHMVYKT